MLDARVVDYVVVAGAVLRVVAGLLVATPSGGARATATRGGGADLGSFWVILSFRSSSACHPCSLSIHELRGPPRLMAGQSSLLQPVMPFSIVSNHTGRCGEGS